MCDIGDVVFFLVGCVFGGENDGGECGSSGGVMERDMYGWGFSGVFLKLKVFKLWVEFIGDLDYCSGYVSVLFDYVLC